MTYIVSSGALNSTHSLTQDTYANFAFKLQNVFKHWLDGVKAYGDVDMLRQTMLLEQLCSCLPDDLKLWLSDQKPTMLSQAAQLADQYVALRKSVSVKQPVSGDRVYSVTDPKLCAVCSKQSVTEEKPATKKRNDFRIVTCFRCPKRGHIISLCRVKLKKPTATNVVQKEQSDVQLVNQSVCSVNVHPLFKPYCTAGCIVSDTGERTQLNILRDTAALQSLLSSRSRLTSVR